jgi:hypothetical protein
MFIHSVYFWLREDLTEEERQRFIRGVNSLTSIESVHYAWVGRPASTNRPVIERGYSYSLTAVFDDDAAQDAYQVDPVHDVFREECGSLWSRVLIYDSVEES